MKTSKVKKIDSPLGKVVTSVVEGQIKSFLKDHPEITEAVIWKHSHKTKQDALISSLAKRIIRDLCCAQTEARLRTALLEVSADEETTPLEAGY